MKKRFVRLVLLVFAVTIGIVACGGTSSDNFSENSSQQLEESEKDGLKIIFMDPNYSGCDSHFRQRAVASEQEQLAENEYLVTGENQISDSAGSLTIEELQSKFERTLTSNDLGEETDQENLDESVSEEPSRNLNEFDKTIPFYKFCVRVHGMDYHACEPCVSEKVYHVNISLMRDGNDSPRKYWANLHVGAFRNSTGGLCLLVFEKVKDGPMRICWRDICGPSRLDLQRTINRAMTDVLASARINVSAYVVSLAAITLSFLIYPALMAL